MIGIIGLGNMGYAIAQRLTAEGESLTVWNRTPNKAKGLENVSLVATPGDVVTSSEIILSVLADDAATQAVYFEEHGILSAALAGKVVVEFCTMAPERAKALELAVSEKQGLFLECPVGGTVGPAREGKLLGLAGGSADAFAAAEPVLRQLTRRLEHVGATGQGAAMKLAINLPLMVYWSALGEALGIALSYDVDPALALDVLADSSGAIGAAKKRVPPIRDMLVDGNSGSTNFSLENAIKDMELMVAAASAQSTPSDVIAGALTRSKQAQEHGFTGLDCSLVAALNNMD